MMKSLCKIVMKEEIIIKEKWKIESKNAPHNEEDNIKRKKLSTLVYRFTNIAGISET